MKSINLKLFIICAFAILTTFCTDSYTFINNSSHEVYLFGLDENGNKWDHNLGISSRLIVSFENANVWNYSPRTLVKYKSEYIYFDEEKIIFIDK